MLLLFSSFVLIAIKVSLDVHEKWSNELTPCLSRRLWRSRTQLYIYHGICNFILQDSQSVISYHGYSDFWHFCTYSTISINIFILLPSPSGRTIKTKRHHQQQKISTYQWGWSIRFLVCQREAVCFCLGPQLVWVESHWGDSLYSGDRTNETSGVEQCSIIH